MNFFEHQDRARASTKKLVFLFVLSVIAIIFAIYLVFIFLFKIGVNDPGTPVPLWQPEAFLLIACATGTVILLGSLFRVLQLSSGGGVAVAEALGGRLIPMETGNPKYRQLLNIVEEMAIASGLPVPPVYIMEEDGINAFAAGNSPEDAVIGVTNGALNAFTREEMQGVIAHEYSHILNGDMTLNIRIMSVLHGILIIAILGGIIMRSVFFAPRRKDDKGGGAIAILVLGLALTAIGYIGVFFGNLIKSAVSRQREFLADASAVQFTRNPNGIANALRRIAGWSEGSRVQTPAAQEASHMFFGNALGSGLMSLFSTHPPLEERIRRIDKNADISAGEPSAPPATSGTSTVASGFAGAQKGDGIRKKAEDIVDTVGTLDQRHIEHASSLIASIPEKLRSELSNPHGARAVVYLLLLDDNPEIRAKQSKFLLEHADAQVLEMLPRLKKPMEENGAFELLRIPMIDLAIPALKTMSEGQYRQFRNVIDGLVKADNNVDLFEYTLHRILARHLDPVFLKKKPVRQKYASLPEVKSSTVPLLSVLAYVGAKGTEEPKRAFGIAIEKLNDSNFSVLNLLPSDACSLGAVDKALEKLEQASPTVKKKILTAGIAAIAADDCITQQESQLIRAIADSLSCPLPPILPDAA